MLIAITAGGTLAAPQLYYTSNPDSQVVDYRVSDTLPIAPIAYRSYIPYAVVPASFSYQQRQQQYQSKPSNDYNSYDGNSNNVYDYASQYKYV